MMVDAVAAVVAFVLGLVALGLYRAAQRAERRICEQLHHDRVDRLIERAGDVRERLHEINGGGDKDKAKREVEAALAASDEQERERVKAADYVWRTDGSDGGQSSGDAEVATVGALASLLGLLGSWWARLVILIGALALLLLVVLSGTHPDPRFGRVVSPEHRAEQVRLMRQKFKELGRSEEQIDELEQEIAERFPTTEEIER